MISPFNFYSSWEALLKNMCKCKVENYTQRESGPRKKETKDFFYWMKSKKKQDITELLKIYI